MAFHLDCDGFGRRDFLKVGVIGASGLSLSQYLQAAESSKVPGGKATSGIFINLGGGPTHMDTFDLKPNAPEEYRGEFKPMKTNVSGVEISEHLPKLAGVMDKFAILRGVSHSIAAHDLGTEYVNSGNRPIPSLEYPGYGAVMTKEKQAAADLPPFVAIPNSRQRAGYLGVQYSPLNTGSTPKAGTPFSVRGIALRSGLTVADVEKRQNLLGDIDNTFRSLEGKNDLLDGLDRFSAQAHAVITSKKAREAFDISKESPAFAKQFTDNGFAQSCLLATRLVEAGVRFVTISLGGWDTHSDCFVNLKNRLLPTLDSGLAPLFAGLEEKGLLSSTAVLVTGEFGRTPKVNARNGRDHYPRAMFMLMAGGSVKGGQALGASDEKGTFPADKGFSPDDVAASFYHNLGIDHTKEYHTNTGRPMMIVRDGHVIPGLFA